MSKRHRERMPAIEENLEAVKTWERTLLESRSSVERISGWITSRVASGPVLLGHLIWFGSWLAANLGLIDSVDVFDPFPFPVLTLLVSLEAIFLALCVLASQNRLSRNADKRAHLDLQINLLAEREMTAVLRLLRDITSHLGVESTVTPEELRDLIKDTDIKTVAHRLETLPESGDDAATAAGPVPDAPPIPPAAAEPPPVLR